MAEHDDLVQALEQQRYLLRNTLRGLTDDQARLRPSASELCLGGLIKHVAMTEGQWAKFITIGPSAMAGGFDEAARTRWASGFEMTSDDTIEAILADYDAVARDTNAVILAADLDATQPLPEAPWFPPGASWTARRVALHILREVAQHSGHADIIRESIDGAKSMG
jgi:hypothetical protein